MIFTYQSILARILTDTALRGGQGNKYPAIAGNNVNARSTWYFICAIVDITTQETNPGYWLSMAVIDL
jgi:hypothetical protein